jgi:hypothetical protein
VTIDINPCKFIFVADRICWWQAFQFGSGSIKMYYSTEWWSCLMKTLSHGRIHSWPD